MQRNVLEYLENTVEKFPEKIAFADGMTALSFRELEERAMRLGTNLAARSLFRKPVIVYMKKSPAILAAFFGVVYSGAFYVPVDEEMPKRRIELILESTKTGYMICDETTEKEARTLDFKGEILLYSDCLTTDIDESVLGKIRERVLDVDPVYVFYTSGSTGVPKGVVGCHRGIIDYTEQLSEVLGFDESCIFANQTPMYWDASMKEIYGTLKHGATTYLVPKELFMFPVKLVEYLNEYRINTICWVVSALVMISAFGTFDLVKPEYLRLVAFCGEVFPVKQFNKWKSQLPDVDFYNLYGPTEATGVSTYYHADRFFDEKETIPIGKPFANTQILLLNEKGERVETGKVGEICVRGSGVSLGYFGDREKTNQVFVQNPEHDSYRDIIYRTGDLARMDDEGNLVFVSRLDSQIKHMGHRIELGEIEADVNAVEGVEQCCCIYSKEKNKIVLYYTGVRDKAGLTRELKGRLPRYMLPNAICQLEAMPHTINGKIDRMKLQKIYMDKP